MSLRNQANADLIAVAANHPPIVQALLAGQLEDALSLIATHSRAISDIDLASGEFEP